MTNNELFRARCKEHYLILFFFQHYAGCECTTAAVLEMKIPKNVVGYVPRGLGGTNPVYFELWSPQPLKQPYSVLTWHATWNVSYILGFFSCIHQVKSP